MFMRVSGFCPWTYLMSSNYMLSSPHVLWMGFWSFFWVMKVVTLWCSLSIGLLLSGIRPFVVLFKGNLGAITKTILRKPAWGNYV